MKWELTWPSLFSEPVSLWQDYFRATGTLTALSSWYNSLPWSRHPANPGPQQSVATFLYGLWQVPAAKQRLSSCSLKDGWGSPSWGESLQLEPTARTVTDDTTALMCWLWSHTLLVVVMASLVRADAVSRCMRWCGVSSLQKTSFSYLEPKTRKWNYKREVDLPAGEVPIGRLIPALLWRWLWSFGKGLWESHNPKMWVLFSWRWHGLHL